MKNKKIVLISGKKRSGKDTVADTILENVYLRGRVWKLSFALPLKQLCHKAFKDHGPFFHKKGFQYLAHNWYEQKTEFTRKMLQIVGTEIIQSVCGERYWAEKCAHDIQYQLYERKMDVVVIADWRWEHELEVLRETFGSAVEIHTIRVNRDIGEFEKKGLFARLFSWLKRGKHDDLSEHPSETSLDDFLFDTTIDNNKTLYDLQSTIGRYVRKHLND